MDPTDAQMSSTCPGTNSTQQGGGGIQTVCDFTLSPDDTRTGSMATSKDEEDDTSNAASSDCKSPGQRYVNKTNKQTIAPTSK